MAVTEWLGTTDGDYQNAANWTSGVPGAGDDVYFKSGANPVDTNLANGATLLGTFHVEVGYTGLVGTEDDFLVIQAPLAYIGTNPTGSSLRGSQRLNLSFITTAVDVTVEISNSAAVDVGRTPIRLLTGHASSRLFMTGGSVSLSDDPSDTSTIALIDMSGGNLTIGEVVTLVDITCRGSGQVLLQSDPSGTLTVIGGGITTALAVAIPLANVIGGTLTHNGSGTIASAVLTGGELDLSRSTIPRIVTAISMTGDSDFVFDPSIITLTNDIVAATGVPLRLSTTDES